jgi:hypothetical protein
MTAATTTKENGREKYVSPRSSPLLLPLSESILFIIPKKEKKNVKVISLGFLSNLLGPGKEPHSSPGTNLKIYKYKKYKYILKKN